MEREGFSTASISLVRPQTVKMKPPRAMWVPFELGRPFGAPNNPKFQTKVLKALLKTLEAESGPVLADFDEDAPLSSADTGEEQEGWACPIELKAPPPQTEGDTAALEQALLREINQLRPWYELSVEQRGRTTVGVSPLDIDGNARYIIGFLGDEWPESPSEDMTATMALKHAFEDVRAWYFEAVAAQPGRATGTSDQVIHWFWHETTAGAVLQKLDEVCRESDDETMQAFGGFLLLPRYVTGSVGDGSDGRKNAEFGDNQAIAAAE
ncbi:MAG: hypothetical protein CL569_02150 [Alphaproteobacteria bacterium]|nr:hypothetical protein [Alphaproteobacteria bacterium]